MDGTQVNRELRQIVWPLLRQQGFGAFEGRRAWRHREHTVDCLRFWSPYNWVEAAVKGVTTFSFQVEMGIYWADIPPQGPDPKEKGGRLFPRESECQIRHTLEPPAGKTNGSLPYLWYIDPEGTGLAALLAAVRDALVSDALPWFERYGDPAAFLELLLNEEESPQVGWGYGRNDSLARHYLTGYVAKKCGRNTLTVTHLEAYLETAERLSKIGVGTGTQIRQRVESDLALLRLDAGRQ